MPAPCRSDRATLDLIELVHILALVKENLTVTIINDGTLDNRRRNDVLHFLGHDHGLTEKLSDGLEKIAEIIPLILADANGLPGLLR